ncbi:hypothetical protein Dip510_000231 [Elusimicrobium posterum]|uniref:hypothetical protein n=1 Tax=Elusimicrobium posterum TaxID=3116653 RepID=UPI003C73260C
MKNTFKLFVFAAAIFAVAGCASLGIGPKGEGEYVYAESLVPYNDIDLDSTKKEGIAAAQRAAVEQVAGVFVSATTTVDHSQVVQSQILSKTDGFIRRYNVTKSYRRGDQWYTRIKALVLVKDISDVIKESSDSALVKKTNVMVASRELIADNASYTQDCKQAVYKQLKDSPYYLMNGDALSQSNLDDPSPVMDKARYEGARFIIMADVNSAPLNMLTSVTTPFKTYRASVNMRVYSTKNYGIVATASSQQSGLDPVESIAAQKAIAAACEAATKDILEPLKSAVNSARTFNLKVTDVNSIDRLRDLQTILKDLRELEDFNLTRYSNSAAYFEIQANIKSADELAAKIIRQYNARFTVEAVDTQNIVLKLM